MTAQCRTGDGSRQGAAGKFRARRLYAATMPYGGVDAAATMPYGDADAAATMPHGGVDAPPHGKGYSVYEPSCQNRGKDAEIAHRRRAGRHCSDLFPPGARPGAGWQGETQGGALPVEPQGDFTVQ